MVVVPVWKFDTVSCSKHLQNIFIYNVYVVTDNNVNDCINFNLDPIDFQTRRNRLNSLLNIIFII